MPPPSRIRAQGSCHPGAAALIGYGEEQASQPMLRPPGEAVKPELAAGHGTRPPEGKTPGQTTPWMRCSAWLFRLRSKAESSNPASAVPPDCRELTEARLENPASEESSFGGRYVSSRRRGGHLLLREQEKPPVGLVPTVPARDSPRPGLRTEDQGGRRGPGRHRAGEGPPRALPALSVGPLARSSG